MVDGLRSLQHQVTDMSANLTTRLDELQSRGVSPSPAAAYYGTEHRGHMETSVALSEIRSQLHELTRSLESCQSEVTEVKRDMVAIKNELDTVQQVKEEIEELREYVDRLELQSHRRKLRLLEQVRCTVRHGDGARETVHSMRACSSRTGVFPVATVLDCFRCLSFVQFVYFLTCREHAIAVLRISLP